MNIIKNITLLLTLLIVILMTGCSPRESASEVAKKYIDKMNSGDYETAYSLLSKDSCLLYTSPSPRDKKLLI